MVVVFKKFGHGYINLNPEVSRFVKLIVVKQQQQTSCSPRGTGSLTRWPKLARVSGANPSRLTEGEGWGGLVGAAASGTSLCHVIPGRLRDVCGSDAWQISRVHYKAIRASLFICLCPKRAECSKASNPDTCWAKVALQLFFFLECQRRQLRNDDVFSCPLMSSSGWKRVSVHKKIWYCSTDHLKSFI